MLKIKDNVDLKELEKYGFKNIKIDGLEDEHYILEFARYEYIVISDRILKFYESDELYQMYSCKRIFDVIYDLIKADLVEKVE